MHDLARSPNATTSLKNSQTRNPSLLFVRTKYTNPQAHFESTTSNHLKRNKEQLVINTLDHKQNSHYKNSYKIDIKEIGSSLCKKTRDLKFKA